MTKSLAKDAKTAQEHLEGSLRRLNTDHLDLWQAHAVTSKEDADARLKDGVFDYMRKMKQEGKVRYIGFTGHTNAAAHAYLLERLKEVGMLDTVQMPVNPVDAAHSVSFVKQAMPIAKEQEYGILAMKTLAGGQFFAEKRQLDNVMWTTNDPVVPGRFSMVDTLNFSWSLPISVLITGASTKKMILEKIAIAKKHMSISQQQRQNLIDKVVDISEAEKVEYYRNRS
jgi:predicted aldo/keto reductase-like oxidoreductase